MMTRVSTRFLELHTTKFDIHIVVHYKQIFRFQAFPKQEGSHGLAA